jgi:hypothetical protein
MPTRFDKCVESVARKGSADDPRAVCASIGRRKYGKRKFQAIAAAGRRRRARRNPANPVEEAQEVYEQFHGRPSEELIEVETPIHEHGVLSALGELKKLVILTSDGKYRVTLKKFKGAWLAQNENRTQLFIEGGDQSVHLKDFGIDPERAHESEVLGSAVKIYYATQKDHLGRDGGRAVYRHLFGGRGARSVPMKKYPTVTYDTVNRLLSFHGGVYSIPDEGIVD